MTPIRSSPSRWLWGLLAAIVAGLIWWHATILLPFVISIILAYVLRPAVDALEKRRCPRALAAMARLGIETLQQRSYHELSGGQQQRALLARALCATQRLLLLDEPAAGLDPIATQELYQTIGQLNRQDGITVIMVSHDVDAAVANASHILHLRTQPLFYGTAQAYRGSEAGRLYLREVNHA